MRKNAVLCKIWWKHGMHGGNEMNRKKWQVCREVETGVERIQGGKYVDSRGGNEVERMKGGKCRCRRRGGNRVERFQNGKCRRRCQRWKQGGMHTKGVFRCKRR